MLSMQELLLSTLPAAAALFGIVSLSTTSVENSAPSVEGSSSKDNGVMGLQTPGKKRT
jgi:hypothetical protein